MKTRRGRCVNRGHCTLADSEEVVEIDAQAEFVCPRDGRVLEEVRIRTGRCINVGQCPLANSGEPIELEHQAEFVCPEDGRPLEEVKPASTVRDPARVRRWATLALLLTAVPVVWCAVRAGLKTPLAGPCDVETVSSEALARGHTYLGRGALLIRRARFPEAGHAFEEVLGLYAGWPGVRSRIAASRLAAKEPKKSAGLFQADVDLISKLETSADACLTRLGRLPLGGDTRVEGLAAAQLRVWLRRLKAEAYYGLAAARALQQDAPAAVQALRQAHKEHFLDRELLKTDPDFEPIRKAAEFRRLIALLG